MKLGIIGIGGKTATMFAQELKNGMEIFGIGKEKEIELIEKKKIFVERNQEKILFQSNLIRENDFPKGIYFDALFLAIKNPIDKALFYYYQKIKKLDYPPPALFLSQNGIEVGEIALKVLKQIFKEKINEISIFRISLFNAVEKKIKEGKYFIVYSLPIQMAISKIWGKEEKFLEIFNRKNFKIFKIPSKKAKEMEFSKLFLNLIGMASASQGLSIKEGFSRKEIFKEEIEVLREFKRVAKARKINFLNFPQYPVKTLSFLISLPDFLIFPFRNFLAKKIEEKRNQKEKDFEEIDFYNGAVVKLGKELGISTPTNIKILERIKK